MTARADFPRTTRVDVRWGDMDALQHVNNAAFFTYCESARMALFAELALEQWSEGGAHGPVLVTANLTYRQQVRYPATIDVGLRIAKLGTTSFTLDYGLFAGAALVAEGSSVVVWADYAAGEKRPLPDGLRAALEG